MNKRIVTSLACLLSLVANPVHADQFQATINIDPSFYTLGGLNLPLQLDFQLNSGGAAPVSNTISLSNFSFVTSDANAVSFGAANLSGNVSGDLSSAVSLTDDASNSFNEFFQSFSTNVKQISFDINTTTNINPLAADSFNVALLDSSSGFPQIPTTDPLGVSLISLNLSDPLSANSYLSASTLPGVNANIAAVPLPASVWLFATALSAAACRQRRLS